MIKKGTKLAGWVCALFALGLIVSAWREKGQGDGGESGGKTAPATKPSPRDQDRRGSMAGELKNPREVFETARKRGLTDLEVRWIVEDFHELGYSELKRKGGKLNEFRGFRSRAWQWYSDLLAEGFGFTGEQERRVSKRLQEMSGNDFSTQLKVFANLMPDPSQDVRITPENMELMGILLGTGVWLRWQKYEAWELCELSDDQMEIGWGKIARLGQSWSAGGERTKDFGTDEFDNNLGNYFHEAYKVLSNAGTVFPLSMEQVERMRNVEAPDATAESEDKAEPAFLDMVKFLTAPQLMTLLLFQPEMAGQLLEDLEK